jgi:hypothetical protein
MAEEPAPSASEGTAAADGATGDVKQTAPADALSRSSDDLAQEAAANPESQSQKPSEPVKKVSPIKAIFKKINVYLLLFLLVAAIVAATGVISYLNNKKAPTTPSVANQQLSQDSLKQLANSDATVGAAAQTLTIQGNAIIAGQTLIRGSLDVAGGIKLGGEFTAGSIVISGKANFTDTQISSLQVAQNTALQGLTTTRDLNVGGTAAFGGPVTAGQITVSRLVISGNGTLDIPNHLSFSGPTPSRSILDAGVMGAGGTVNVNGSDTTGTINVNTGTGPVAGCFAKISFALPFSNMPHVLVTPFGQATAGLNWYVLKTKTSFTVCTTNAPPGGQVFGFDFFITN